MSDTVKTTRELKIDMYFVDGDTRVQRLKNPRTNITSQEIIDLQTLIRTNNLLIGDRARATFGRISTADIVNTTVTDLDLST